MRELLFFVVALSLSFAKEEKRIIQGNDATQGQFPYIAAIIADGYS